MHLLVVQLRDVGVGLAGLWWALRVAQAPVQLINIGIAVRLTGEGGGGGRDGERGRVRTFLVALLQPQSQYLHVGVLLRKLGVGGNFSRLQFLPHPFELPPIGKHWYPRQLPSELIDNTRQGRTSSHSLHLHRSLLNVGVGLRLGRAGTRPGRNVGRGRSPFLVALLDVLSESLDVRVGAVLLRLNGRVGLWHRGFCLLHPLDEEVEVRVGGEGGGGGGVGDGLLGGGASLLLSDGVGKIGVVGSASCVRVDTGGRGPGGRILGGGREGGRGKGREGGRERGRTKPRMV